MHKLEAYLKVWSFTFLTFFSTLSHGQGVRTFTYLLSPWCRILLEKLTGFQLIKKFPAFYGTRRFITAFTRARHLSLSRVRSNQSVPPHPTSWRCILILFSHLRLGPPSGLFPSGFPAILYTPILSPIRTTSPARLIRLDFITRKILGEEYRSLSSSWCSFLHSPVNSSLLHPNILLNTQFSNTLSLRSSLNVIDQVKVKVREFVPWIWNLLKYENRKRIPEKMF